MVTPTTRDRRAVHVMTITVTSLYYLVLPCAVEYAINRYKGTSEGEVISSLASRISSETGEGL